MLQRLPAHSSAVVAIAHCGAAYDSQWAGAGCSDAQLLATLSEGELKLHASF